MRNLSASTWLFLGGAIAIVGYGSYVLARTPPTTPAIAATSQPDLLIQGAIQNEAQRLKSFAGTDPECGSLPNATDAAKVTCFLDRLDKENTAALAQALFRASALKEARAIGNH